MFILTDDSLINLDDISTIFIEEKRKGKSRLVARMKDGSQYILKQVENKNFNLFYYLMGIATSESEGFEIHNISSSELS